jgi:hypothetical protein
MYDLFRTGRVRGLPLMGVILAVVAVCMLAAAPALAAPTGPTMSLSDLQTAITAAGPGGLDGYFSTVLQGSTITPVAVKIMAVANGQNPEDGSPLILFQITDPTVFNMGGLAEGMSGSPLCVGKAAGPLASDPLVGAVSYGDTFTTQGLGLATPIGLMSSIESKYTVDPALAFGPKKSAPSPLVKAAGQVLPRTRALSLTRALRTSAGPVHRFIVARNHSVARVLHPAAGTAVFAPLSAVEVGGLPAGGRAFKTLSAQLAKRGVDLIPAAGGAGGANAPFTTALVPGASVAAVLAHGYFWAAFVGTVTYTDTDSKGNTVVVAFGHPADFDGASGLEMANAWVSGIWASTYTPYKLVSLGAVRGLITQDRTYGIAGVESATAPSEVAVNATATLGTGAAAGTTTYVPTWVADNVNWNSEIIPDACYFPVFQATDAGAFPGSATTDTVVKVADGNGPVTPAAELKNVWDDSHDVGYYTTTDIADMVDYLTENQSGTAPGTITEVDFTAALTPTHRGGEVLDFSIPGGLRIGQNTVRAVVRDYGESGTHEVDIPLTVPAGSKLSGDVEVYGGAEGSSYDNYFLDGSSNAAQTTTQSALLAGVPGVPAIAPSETLADLVADVNKWPVNDSLEAAFNPDGSDSVPFPVGVTSESANLPTGSVTLTDATGPLYATGDIDKTSSDCMLHAMPSVVAPGHSVRLIGMIEASDAAGTKVAIYRGDSAKPLGHVTVLGAQHGLATFEVKVQVKSTTTFRAVWDGSENSIGARASCRVQAVAHR